MDLLEYDISLIWNLVTFGSMMLDKGRPSVWAYDRYVTNALSYHIYDNYSHGSWNVYPICISHFTSILFHFWWRGFSFSKDLRDHQYGIVNFF